MKLALIAALVFAPTLAFAAPAATPAPDPKDAQIAQLQQANQQLSGVLAMVRQQRDLANDQVAQLAAQINAAKQQAAAKPN